MTLNGVIRGTCARAWSRTGKRGRFCHFHGTAGDAGGDLVGERMELEEDGQEWICKLDSGREMDLYLSRMEKFFFQKW